MTRSPLTTLPRSERDRRLRRWIRRGEKGLVSRFPLFRHPDAIASVCTLSSASGMIALGGLYAIGRVSAPVCILANAFFASILHEIEHDLIHRMYFPSTPLAGNAGLLLAWVFRGNVVHALRFLIPGHVPPAWFVPFEGVVDVLAIAWVFPNIVRQACLTIVSSNVHYYGDVDGVTAETHVLRPLVLWPLQLFCWNFGTTHAVRGSRWCDSMDPRAR